MTTHDADEPINKKEWAHRALNFYRQEDRHESNLVSERVRNVLTATAFLVTAFGFVFSKPVDSISKAFLLVLSFFGIFISCAGIWGVGIYEKLIGFWTEKERKLRDGNGSDQGLGDDPDLGRFFHSRYPIDADTEHKRHLKVLYAGPVLCLMLWISLMILATAR